MSAADVLERLSAALDRIGIEYMLTGSFASSYYGVSRSTQDIDFVIQASLEQLKTFVEALGEGNYYVELEAAIQALRRRSMFNVIDLSTGWKADLIIRKARAFSEEEFRRRRRIELNRVPLFIASAEDIIIAKMEWAKMSASARQLDDVASILRLHWDTLDRPYLDKWTVSLELQPQWQETRLRAGIGL
jgi:hypothetical protein